MNLYKLDQSFYTENTQIKQALDYIEGTGWIKNKERGHGVITISINDLIFAIPVRSHIKHDACKILEQSRSRDEKGMGLDYSKALLIKDKKYITTNIFVLKSKESGKKLANIDESYIQKSFEKYVIKYIKAVKSNDDNILKSKEYRFTTLINYHTEIGL